MGRGAAVVNAVASFPGSVWDLSDPDAPRRLNLLLRERPDAADGQWTPGGSQEYLLVMLSDYDGSGSTYAGRNLALQTVDCAWVVAVSSGSDGLATVEADIRRALVWPMDVTRTASTPSETTLTWSTTATGASLRVRRLAPTAQTGEVVATLPPTATSYVDTGYPEASSFRYRVDVVNAAGQIVATSPRSTSPIPQGAHRLTVRGTLALPRVASDVWGYVGPDGREYALLNASGLTVVDVTDPQPVEVAYLPGGESDIEAAGHYVYVTGNGSQVQVIDISDPTAPVLVRSFWAHPSAPNVGVHTLSIADGRLFLTGNAGNLSIWSLADPSQPVYLSTYRPEGMHDVLVRGDTMFVAMIGGPGVDVVDISDPTAPTRLTTFNYPNSGAHNICASADGRYLFVGDEVGLGPWTYVFDIAELDNVELVAQIVVNPEAIVHNCHVRGNRLFLGHYTMGARVWDISDPTQPVEVAYNNEFVPNTEVSSFAGAWSAYPHLPSGRVLVSNYSWSMSGDASLVVLELDPTVGDEPAPSPAGGALALTVAPNPATGASDAFVTLADTAPVTVDVLDVLGRRMARVEAGRLTAGTHRVPLPASALPAGVYLIRVVAGATAATRRLTIQR